MQAMTDSTRGPFAAPETAGKLRGAATADRIRSLFAEIAEGRAAALEGLYDACADELHGLALWRTGSQTDAADVVQEVFVRVAGARHKLSAIREPLAYLRRMTHRAAIDVHRRRSRRREDPLEDCPFLESPDPSPERRLDAGLVSRLLTQLPPGQREAIYLRHFAGCSYAEIGRAMGVPTFTAASRYRLGLRRLRILLGVER
jgi:RNA polymerase sigma-70 factor (ECF subfamily)